MADKKISALTAASTLDGTEVLPVVQSATTKKATVTQVLAGAVSDTAYDATSWDGVTGAAPSKNAVRDAIEALAATYVGIAERNYGVPTGALAQTFGREGGVGANVAPLASGTLFLESIYLRAGQSLSSITWVAGTQALVAGTAQWFAIYSLARARLAVTADDTNVAWNAGAAKTLAITGAPYVVPASGFYYLGINVVAGTVPSLTGMTSGTAISGVAPILQGSSTTGLTNPASAPDPAAALTAIGLRPYAYVS